MGREGDDGKFPCDLCDRIAHDVLLKSVFEISTYESFTVRIIDILPVIGAKEEEADLGIRESLADPLFRKEWFIELVRFIVYSIIAYP